MAPPGWPTSCLDRAADGLDLVAITDHDRIDGATRAAELHAAGDFHFELVVGEEITTRSGHVVGLFLRADPGLPLGGRDRGAHPRPGRLAVAAHPLGVFLSLGTGSPAPAQADPRPDATSTRWSSSTQPRRSPPPPGPRRAERPGAALPGLGNSDAHVLETVASAWTWFPGSTAAEFRSALAAGDGAGRGTLEHRPQRGGARQLVAKPEAAPYSPPVRRVAMNRD